MAENKRAAVVGAGRLGGFHAEKYAAIAGVRLDCVVDIDAARAREIAARHGATPLADFRELKGRVDIASVAVPSLDHFRVASELLAAGIDVLVEKPMAASLAEAQQLAAQADRSDRILQIGHLERFNAAIVRLRSLLTRPRFIECDRLAPFTERGTDVDVIMDLMIHDLDVLLSLKPDSAVTDVEALGVAVLTDSIDVANARIKFSDGTIANVSTSRVAAKRERKIRFFQPDAYISVDYGARTLQLYRKNPPPAGSKYPEIFAELIDLANSDALYDEIASFVESTRSRRMPAVTAADGLRVIELCDRIKRAIHESSTMAL